jgi:L-cystine transport system ATP-binding protein
MDNSTGNGNPVQAVSPADPPVICRLRKIHKSFGHIAVLKGVDMEVKKGDVLAILGPSGSGKTTLLRCINFLEHANDGTIEVDGLRVDCKHVTKKEILALRRKTAMVFQSFNLFKNKTIIQNVTEGMTQVKKVPRASAYEEAKGLLTKVGLESYLDVYPSQLSGGQQQRVGIVRALILNPAVILLDEPTSALDPELVGDVLATIKDLAQTGITMIIVTHEIHFARDVADRVLFLDEGAVVEEGPPSQVIDNSQNPRTRQFLSRFVNQTAGSAS